MSNSLFYLVLLAMSLLGFVGPFRRWLEADTTKAGVLANLSKLIVGAVTSLFGSTLFRLLLLAGGVVFCLDRLSDIDFVKKFGEPQRRMAWQLITEPDEQLPRYVSVPDIVPVETMVEETTTQYSIPTGKAMIYAADVMQSLPADTAAAAATMSRLADPETGKMNLVLFVKQKEETTSEPEAGKKRQVVGQVDDKHYLDSKVADLFTEGGYSVGSATRTINEGVLPDSLPHLYWQLLLLILLVLAQPLLFVWDRIRARQA